MKADFVPLMDCREKLGEETVADLADALAGGPLAGFGDAATFAMRHPGSKLGPLFIGRALHLVAVEPDGPRWRPRWWPARTPCGRRWAPW